MTMIEHGWWRSSEGYVRKVTVNTHGTSREVYVSWRHMCPAIGYFNTFERAVEAMHQQSPTQSWGIPCEKTIEPETAEESPNGASTAETPPKEGTDTTEP